MKKIEYRLSDFGATGWPLVKTAKVTDNPFMTDPNGVELYRKALWDCLKNDAPEGSHGGHRDEILFNLLFLKDDDVFYESPRNLERAHELHAVIRRASAYFKQKYRPSAEAARRPWNLTREQFYTLPHTVAWAKGKKGQWVKQYTDPSGKVTRNFPDFHKPKEIVDQMYRMAQRWAYEHNELDD